MIDANLGVIATILRGMGFTMGFLGALFAFGAWLQNDRHEKTKVWFEKKWDGISQSRWRTMPEKVIQAVIRGKDRVAEFIVDDLISVDFEEYVLVYIVSVDSDLGDNPHKTAQNKDSSESTSRLLFR